MSTGIIMRVSSMSSNESYVFELLEEDSRCYCAVPGTVIHHVAGTVDWEVSKKSKFSINEYIIMTTDVKRDYPHLFELYELLDLV